MTIKDRPFRLTFLAILLTGGIVWMTIFLAMYHPVLVMRNTFMALDTNFWSLSLQWSHGQLALWFSANRLEWRLWPLQ